MRSLDNITTGDKYTDANTIESPAGFRLAYLVGNNAVRAQFRPYSPTGTLLPWTPADPGKLITPEANTVEHVSGFRVRSAVAGSPAQVIADLYEPDDPLAGSPIPYTATLSPSGGQTPGKSSVQIQVDGTLVGTEPTLDFLTGLGIAYVGTDDTTNQRVTLAIAAGAKLLADTGPLGVAGAVSFTGIPQTYKNLLLVGEVAYTGAGDQLVYCQFNGDATAAYTALLGWITSAGAAGATSNVSAGAMYLADCPGSGSAGEFASFLASIPNYASAIAHPVTSHYYSNGVAIHIGTGGGRYKPAAAAGITRIDLSATTGAFAVGSRIGLYGLS